MKCITCKYCINRDESSGTAVCDHPELPRNARGDPRPILLFQYACPEYEYKAPETKSSGNKKKASRK